jgi:hypothetical protein
MAEEWYVSVDPRWSVRIGEDRSIVTADARSKFVKWIYNKQMLIALQYAAAVVDHQQDLYRDLRHQI